MLVLLVSSTGVVVDDAGATQDGEPPPFLTFPGPDVIVDANVHRGPPLHYGYVGRANLDPHSHLVDLQTAVVEESVGSTAEHAALEELRALPVYLLQPVPERELPPGARPHLRLAAPVEVDPAAGGARQLDEVPHFDLGGFAAALSVGGLVGGMRVRLTGFDNPGFDGLYDVVAVRPGEEGGQIADVLKVGETEPVALTAAVLPVGT